MGFSAYLTIGGLLVGSSIPRNVGSVMLAAYALMQMKKMGFDGLSAHSVSFAIWCAAAMAVAAFSHRANNYGISLTYAACSFLLVLVGTCYLWARLSGSLSGAGELHSIATDTLAACAMLLAGRGLGGQIVSALGRTEFLGLGGFDRG